MHAAKAVGSLASGAKNALKQLAKTSIQSVFIGLALFFLFNTAAERLVSGLLDPLASFWSLRAAPLIIFAIGQSVSTPVTLILMALGGLNLREATILGVMILFSHDLERESSLMRRAGSVRSWLPLLRFLCALGAGWGLGRVLPFWKSRLAFWVRPVWSDMALWPGLGAWCLAFLRIFSLVFLLLIVIRIIQRLLEDLRVLELFEKLLGPIMKIFGMPAGWSRYWVTANISEYEFCSAQLKNDIDSGAIRPQDADLFNHHAAFCHSLFSDTALYTIVGMPFLWTLIPRLVAAFLVVWIEKLRRRYVKHSFRAGVA